MLHFIGGWAGDDRTVQHIPSGDSLIAGRVVRELLWREVNFRVDLFLLRSRIPLQLVRIFQKHPRFEHRRFQDSWKAIHQERNWGMACDSTGLIIRKIWKSVSTFSI